MEEGLQRDSCVGGEVLRYFVSPLKTSCSSCGQGAKDGLTFRFLHAGQIERPDPVPQADNPRFKVALRGRNDLHDRTGKGDLAYPLGAERNPDCLPMDSDLVRHGENTIDFLRADRIHVAPSVPEVVPISVGIKERLR